MTDPSQRPRTGRRIAHATRHKLVEVMRRQAKGARSRAPLVVGVSGYLGELAPETVAAVDWAAREADCRGIELYVVSVVEWRSVPSWSRRADNLVVAELQRFADAAVDAALDLIEAHHADTVASGAVLRGDALAVLRTLGSAAGAVVVGTRRLPRLGEILLGSLSAGLSACAPCPVIVVSDRAPGPGGVVVGVDEDNEAALRFAADYAQLHRLELHALYAHAPLLADERVFRGDADRWVHETLAGVCTDYPDLAIRSSVHLHRTVETLLQESREQRLLVVGRRHRSRYPALHVGSVSQAVLHHAPCPVAVVPCGSPTARR
ncbi:MAG TPA: universal stress protein [Jatrophihabitans sp.]|jgi:nucleotide-binding universal stress UspA family protein